MSEQLDLRDAEIAQLRRELEIAKSQAIQARAQAVTVAAERDELRQELSDLAAAHRRIMEEDCPGDEVHCTCVPMLRRELKDARDELAVYRLASETAMYEAGQFDAGLFLSGDRGVEDVMQRVLQRLAAARQSRKRLVRLVRRGINWKVLEG